MSQFHLRNAHPGDAPFIAGLATQLGYPSEAEEMMQRMDAVLRQPHQAVLVAEASGQVLGWVHVFGAYRVESPPFAEIGGLIVDQAHRGLGIGQALVKAACQFAAQEGFRQIRVRSNVARQETHGFYLRFGFSTTKSQAVFSMPLSPP